MNIAVINTFDAFGGAANAARRLNKGLNLLEGHSSVMVVREKRSQDKNAVQVTVSPGPDRQRYLDVIDRINRAHVIKNRTPLTNTLFTLGYPGYDISRTEIIARADILNIHWVSKFQSTEST
ncbi:MAG: hypothetical protein GY950_03875, partial [bacterium]|nr:hypothetical protein [bacterium]